MSRRHTGGEATLPPGDTNNENRAMNSLVDLHRITAHPLPHRYAGDSANSEALELGPLNELLGYHLRRAQSRLYQTVSKQLEANRLTPGQMGLLIKIQNNPGISQTALAKANGIERSTLGEIIERFLERELVARQRHPDDGRAYALSLTSRGHALLAAVVPQVLATEAELTAAWSDDEKQTLLRLLTKLAGPQTGA